MREIKFRVWDGTGMTPNATLQELIKWSLAKPQGESDELDSSIFLQFTGLTDRNGKEIYEGDIVRWTLNPMGSEPETNQMPVERLNNGLYVPHINNTSEVIGNIYENPELLEATK